MRRRVLLLALLAGGLATASGAALVEHAAPGHDLVAPATAFARTEITDVTAPTAFSRARDALGREHDARRDVAVALGVALVLTLGGGWWLARERAGRVHTLRWTALLRTRAPPATPAR